MKMLIYSLIVLLAIVHHDFWWWDKIDPLVFWFIPMGLAYHAGISLAAGILWACAVKYCWPTGLEDEASDGDANASSQGDHA